MRFALLGLFAAALGCVPAQEEAEEMDGSNAAVVDEEPLDEGPVGYLLTSGTKGEWHCAATLVSPTALVTAASCVDPAVFDPQYTPVKAPSYGRLVFFLADPNRTHTMSITPRIAHSVRKVVISPEWSKVPLAERGAATLGPEPGPPVDGRRRRPAADGADLAVVVLDEPVKIKPMPLDPEEFTVHDSPVEIVGFGGTLSPSDPVKPRRALKTTHDRDAESLNHIFDGVGVLAMPKGFGSADRGGAVVARIGGRDVLVGVAGRRSSRTGANGQKGDVVTTAVLRHHLARGFPGSAIDAK